MAGNDAKMDWTGDSAGARKAIDRLIAKIDKLQKKAKKTNSSQKKGLSAVKEGAMKAGAALGGIAIGYSAISNQLSGMIQQQMKFNQLQQQMSVAFDQGQTKLMVQGGFGRNSKEAKFLRNKVANISNLLATNIADVQGGLTEFISAGGGIGQIKSGVFDEIARLGKATNNSDLAGLSKQILVQISQREGKATGDVTAKEVRKLSVQLVNLFKKETFQTADLEPIAQITSLARAFNIPTEEVLGAFSKIKNIEGEKSDKSAERIKIFMREMAVTSVGKNKVKNEALKTLGLSPKNLEGKGFIQKFEMLGNAVKKKGLSASQATVVFNDLFGGDAGASAFALSQNTEGARASASGLNNANELVNRVRTATSGDAAAEIRINNTDMIQNSGIKGLTVNQKRRIVRQQIRRAVGEGMLDDQAGNILLHNIEQFQDAGQAILGSSVEDVAGAVFTGQQASNPHRLEIMQYIATAIRRADDPATRSQQESLKELKEMNQRAKNNESSVINKDER